MMLVAVPLLVFIVGFVRNLPDTSTTTAKPPAAQPPSDNDSFISKVTDPMQNREAEVQAALETIDFEKNNYQIQLDTTMGLITLDLYPDIAPGHCKNIIGLSKIGYYDGVIFHRVIRDFVCQGGCPKGDGTGGPGYEIKAEFNEKPHVAGTLSMARTSDPDSGGSQFFICLGRVPHLDRKYTVFGQTADDESLANVMKFNEIKTGPGDRPVNEITINSAKVIETPK